MGMARLNTSLSGDFASRGVLLALMITSLNLSAPIHATDRLKSVPLSEFLFLHAPLMPKRELQEIPHLFPADAIACHERVDRILNIARREYPLPADSRRVEGMQDERLQRGPHPIG